jgi:D-threo-aldose 1-dehydrogenase
MERRRLGSTGVAVSTLGFGAAPTGNMFTAIDDGTALAAVDTAWDGGIRYFDTAPHYGLGLSESRLGRALAGRPRDEYVLSTKVGRLLVPNPTPGGRDTEGFDVPDVLIRRRDYSADGVKRSIDASLERLGTDRIDIVLIHDPEDFMDEAVTEAVPALVALREQGVIGAVGAGMNFVDPLRRFVTETDVDVVMVAGRWTLIDRTAAALMADCLERGVSVLAAAPFNSGLLSRPRPAEDAHFNYQPASAAVLDRARGLAEVCDQHGVTLPQAALQFALQHPAVVSVVTGMRTAAQASANLAAAGVEIPASVWVQAEPFVIPV